MGSVALRAGDTPLYVTIDSDARSSRRAVCYNGQIGRQNVIDSLREGSRSDWVSFWAGLV